LQPKLLILDPFVRLHRIDENASGEVAPLLAYLRELQRRHNLAVLVVHHAKKGAGNVRAGQALRGSSEFHAWGDSNLYLRRDGDTLTLAVEHRAAPALKPMKIELVASGEALALQLVEHSETEAPAPSSLDERITAALAAAPSPLLFAELRSNCRVRAATLYERLAALTALRTHRQERRGRLPLALSARRCDGADFPFRFPHALQPVGREVGSRSRIRAVLRRSRTSFPHILLFGPAEHIPSPRPLVSSAGARSECQ